MLTSWTLMGLAQVGQRYDAMFLEAICQRHKGHNDAAFDLLKHCVALDSTRSEAYYYLALYYGALKQKDKAVVYFQKACQKEPDNDTYLETLANAYIGLRKYQEGADALQSLYDKNPDRDDVLGMLIQLYEQLGDYDKAISALTKLETIEGKSERISFAKSNYYSQKGDKKAAIAEMKSLADLYPNDNNFRCLYANTLYTNGQKKKAVGIYQDVLGEEPDNRMAQLAMLAYYNDQKDSVRVDEFVDRVLTNKNATTDDRIGLMRQVISDSEQKGGDSTRVLHLFHRMLDMPKVDSEIAIFCAAYMNLKKMPNDSISQVLERALELTPDHAAARLQLVSYAWQANDRDRVIELCRDARQYNPDEMAFYYYQGIAYYQKEQLDDALDAFQNGISVITQESDPEIVSDFYAVMGDIYHQKGLEKEAFEAYDSCLQWKEDNIGCLNNYAYYLSVKDIRLEDAERMSFRTIKAEPNNATYLDTYAWILFRLHRYEDAVVYIDRTLANDSDSSAVLLDHAGDIYYQAGRHEKALEFWEKALERWDNQVDGVAEREILIRKIKYKKYLSE
ncbi:MAG: tetratricopeptide repeat protein [Bacteroidaceae bacterium]|nr:tetratricopeptide repeat protein [Bacteroidaceae bacterium]